MTYSTLVQIIQKDLPDQHPDFETEFKSLQVHCKQLRDTISIRLVSNNRPFLTWLKTELGGISETIKQKFLEKNLISNQQEITISCLGR